MEWKKSSLAPERQANLQLGLVIEVFIHCMNYVLTIRLYVSRSNKTYKYKELFVLSKRDLTKKGREEIIAGLRDKTNLQL